MAPGIAVANETFAVVVAKRTLHPELDEVGNESKADPVRRARNGTEREASGDGGDSGGEREAVGHRLGLARSPGTELAETRASREVGVGFVIFDAVHGALDAELALEFRPMETEGSLRVGVKIGGFGAVEMGVENEPAGIVRFQQNHPHAGSTGCVRGREGTGGVIVWLVGFGIGEPRGKERNRIRRRHGDRVASVARAGSVRVGESCASIGVLRRNSRCVRGCPAMVGRLCRLFMIPSQLYRRR